jgi:uncharacterized membrane protein
MFGNLFPGVEHLQNIHPIVVHFPIAFLVGAAFFYLLAWVLHKDSLATTAFFILIIGALSAIVTAGTGLYAEEGVMVSRSVRAKLLEHHEELMMTTTILSILLAGWATAARPFPKRGRWIFAVAFLAMLMVMSLGADYGARMVYDYNAGGSACSQPIEFRK